MISPSTAGVVLHNSIFCYDLRALCERISAWIKTESLIVAISGSYEAGRRRASKWITSARGVCNKD